MSRGLVALALAIALALIFLAWLRSGIDLQVESESSDRRASTVGVEDADALPTVSYSVATGSYQTEEGAEREAFYARLQEMEVDLTEEQAEAFLARHGRSASNLIAAAIATHVHTYLDEALEAFPDDPTTLIQILKIPQNRRFDPEWRNELIGRLEAAEPQNAAVRHLRIVALLQAGDSEAAKELMAKAVTVEPWTEHDWPVFQALEKIYGDTGADPLAVKYHVRLTGLSRRLSEVDHLLQASVDYKPSARSAEDHAAWAEAVYEYARICNTDGADVAVDGPFLFPKGRLAALYQLSQYDGSWTERYRTEKQQQEAFEAIDWKPIYCVRVMTTHEVREFLRLLNFGGERAYRYLLEGPGQRVDWSTAVKPTITFGSDD